MKKVKIILTEAQAKELLSLVENSTNTGGEIWDNIMTNIEKAIKTAINA